MLSALGTLTHDPSLAAITLMIRLAALAQRQEQQPNGCAP